jgi:predicted aspartyl protease
MASIKNYCTAFKKILLFLLIVYFTDLLQAQTIYTKDRVPVGDKKEIVKACLENLDEVLLRAGGVRVQADSYCECFANVFSILTASQVHTYSENMDKLMESDVVNKYLINCIEKNFQVEDSYSYGFEKTELEKKLMQKNCVENILRDRNMKKEFSMQEIEQYCSCSLDKLEKGNVTYGDVLQFEDENGLMLNEIVMPCMTDVLMARESKSKGVIAYNPLDIISDKVVSQVPLLDHLGASFKVKVVIGGVVRYFTFDTGASTMLIDRTLEKQLLLDGVLNKQSYRGKSKFALANNSIVTGELAIISGIRIGDFTVNNVEIGIVENGSLLIGLSFLKKFKSWEFDSKKKVLILYK